MESLFPWQYHRRDWTRKLPFNMEQAIGLLNRTKRGKMRRWSQPDVNLQENGLRFEFHSTLRQRVAQTRRPWNIYPEGNPRHPFWEQENPVLLDIAAAKKQQSGQLGHSRVSLQHEFEFDVLLIADPAGSVTANCLLVEESIRNRRRSFFTTGSRSIR